MTALYAYIEPANEANLVSLRTSTTPNPERKPAMIVRRDELIAAHGAACPMPSLLEHLAAPGCAKVGSQWDRCGVHYVEPIEGAR